MLIAIIDYQKVRYNGATAEYRGLGGSEISNIRIAEELVRLGHDVQVFCSTPSPLTYNGVKYLSEAPSETVFDLCLHSRGFDERFFKGKLNFALIHDYNPEYAKNFAALVRTQKIDKIFCMSRWHKLEMMKLLPQLEEKDFYILRMGVKKEFFTPRVSWSDPDAPRLCYTSTPFRGLEHLLTIFPKVRAAIPRAELHLYGGFDIYGTPLPKNELYAEFAKMPGVVVHGNLPQKKLAEELCRNDLFVYPCIYPEVGCIAVKEAITAGLPVVTSPQPAIMELVENGANGEVCNIDAMPEVIISLLKDDKRMKKYRENSLAFNLDWKQTALEIEYFVERQTSDTVSILIAQPVRERSDYVCRNLVGLIFPQGVRLDFVSVAELPVGKAREKLFEIALGDNPKKQVYDFVYFVDDDVYVRKNSLLEMLERHRQTGAAVITQMYFKKHYPLEFAGVAIKNGKEAALYGSEKLEDIYDVSLAPGGATFIDMTQVKKLGKPYFEEKYEGAGEDSYFSMKCRKNGLRCIVDTVSEAIHCDEKTGVKYHRPGISLEDYCDSKQALSH